MIALGVIALGVIARAVSVGCGSPQRGSQKRGPLKLVEHIKTHNTKSRCRNPSNTYKKPPKFSVLSFRRVLVCNLTMV